MAGATSLMDRRRRRKHPSAPVQVAARIAQADPPSGAAPTASTRWTEPTDAALLQAAQRDPLAFAPLYQRYATPVYRYCYRQTSDPEAAADLTAQIFTKALEALPRFQVRDDTSQPSAQDKHGTTVRSWLFAIAHNAIIDARRRERPTQSLNAPRTDHDDIHHDRSPDALADPGIGPEEIAVHRDELGRLLAVLDQVPASQRQIIELRLAGLTTAEVAEALGLTRPAVKAAQTRAYSRLRDLLAPPRPPSPSDTDDPRRQSPLPSSSVEELPT